MKLSLLALASIGLVAADFQILMGFTNDPNDGGGTNENAYFLEAGVKISCDYPGHPRNVYGDASKGGVACDGCGKGPANNWDITRFEMFDDGSRFKKRQLTKTGFGSLTAYLKTGDTYDLVARNPKKKGSERRVGRCERRRGDTLNCFRGLTTELITPIMECFGEEEAIELLG